MKHVSAMSPAASRDSSTIQRPLAEPGARVCFRKGPTIKPVNLLKIGAVLLGLGSADNGGPRASGREHRAAIANLFAHRSIAAAPAPRPRGASLRRVAGR